MCMCVGGGGGGKRVFCAGVTLVSVKATNPGASAVVGAPCDASDYGIKLFYLTVRTRGGASAGAQCEA